MSALDKTKKFIEVAMQQELCKMMSSGRCSNLVGKT